MGLDAGFLYRQNEFALIMVLVALLFVATEIGFRRGCNATARLEETAKSHHSTLQTGVMGLLALLLAFTFSISRPRATRRASFCWSMNPTRLAPRGCAHACCGNRTGAALAD